ncbi:MAG: hypothetical protein J2P31_14095, partial [Blastocatellia bacterium]|nr:hypothetical protein [Blastocatellia bacterium]
MPRRSLKQIFESFFTPRFPLYFLLGALSLGVAVNMLSDLVKHFLASNGDPLRLILVLLLAIVGPAVLVELANRAIAIWARPAADYRFIDRPHPRPARGLIAFVSLEKNEHIRKAIVYHGKTLERVWLIATPKTEPWA